MHSIWLRIFGIVCAVLFVFNCSAGYAANKWDIYMYVCGSDSESMDGAWGRNMDLIYDMGITDENVELIMKFGGAKNSHVEMLQDYIDKKQVWKRGSGGWSEYDVDDKYEDMGKGSSLSDFLKLPRDTVAINKGLVVWNHGGGAVYGVCYDERTGNMMDLNQLHEAVYSTLQPDRETPPLDFVMFSACLMSNIETANCFKDIARYMIASEEIATDTFMSLKPVLACLNNDACIKSDDFAKYIAEDIASRGESVDTYFGTVSVIDLTKLDKLNKAYSDYGKALRELAEQDKAFLTRLDRETFYADNYGGNNKLGGYYNMVDIWALANNTRDVTPAESEALMSAIDEAVVYNANGKYRKSSHGISMYYPLDGNKNAVEWYNKLTVANKDFARIYQDIAGDKGIDIKKLRDWDSYPDENGMIAVNIGAENAAKVETVQEINVQVNPQGKNYFLGSDDRVRCDWEKGIFTDGAETEWLSLNGHIISTFLYAYNDDYRLFVTPLEVNGIRVNLQFVLDTADGNFYPMYTQPMLKNSALKYANKYCGLPGIGDKITILRQTVDENGELSELEPGDTFTLQDELALYNVPLPDGDYIHQFMFRNARNESEVSRPYKIRIENGVSSAAE